MNKVISLLILLQFSYLQSSCKKEAPEPMIDSGLISLTGDYDWKYSEISATDYASSSELEDNYGLRITSDGYMVLFKNGEFVSQHPIFDKGEDLNGKSYYKFWVGENAGGRPIYFTGDSIIWITLTPFDWKNNFYSKQ